MNDSGSYELKLLDGMNILGLWMVEMILGRVPTTLNVMNNSRLYMT